MAEQWQVLLDELRESQFTDLAKLIEEHIAAGKSVPVEEHKLRGKRSIFQPLTYIDTSEDTEAKRTAKSYDLQVLPYTETERENIAIAAVREQFVAPLGLISEIKEKLSGLDIAFASPVEESERVTFAEYVQFLNADESSMLSRAISEHAESQ